MVKIPTELFGLTKNRKNIQFMCFVGCESRWLRRNVWSIFPLINWYTPNISTMLDNLENGSKYWFFPKNHSWQLPPPKKKSGCQRALQARIISGQMELTRPTWIVAFGKTSLTFHQHMGWSEVTYLLCAELLLGFACEGCLEKFSKNILPNDGGQWWFTVVQSGNKSPKHKSKFESGLISREIPGTLNSRDPKFIRIKYPNRIEITSVNFLGPSDTGLGSGWGSLRHRNKQNLLTNDTMASPGSQ